MSNPWVSLWLSAANTWAGAMRSFWTAEISRQQASLANQMARQTTDLWLKAWMAPVLKPTPRRRR